jgi:hypothetical protein
MPPAAPTRTWLVTPKWSRHVWQLMRGHAQRLELFQQVQHGRAIDHEPDALGVEGKRGGHIAAFTQQTLVKAEQLVAERRLGVAQAIVREQEDRRGRP